MCGGGKVSDAAIQKIKLSQRQGLFIQCIKYINFPAKVFRLVNWKLIPVHLICRNELSKGIF